MIGVTRASDHGLGTDIPADAVASGLRYDPNQHDDYEIPTSDPDDDFECYMGPDGQCGAAGSEMCDFECPIRAAIHRRNYEVRQKHLDGQAMERAMAQEREFVSRQLSLPLKMPA
jgi:hypothetical protein